MNKKNNKVWSPQPEKPFVQKSKSKYDTTIKATSLGVTNPTNGTIARGQRAKALNEKSSPKTKKLFSDALQDNIAMTYGGKFSPTSNLMRTENGALGFKSTNSALLDMNFKITSYRNKTDNEICQDFRKAYAENPMLALRWLFWVGDVRGGSGERRLFRVILADLAKNGQAKIVNQLIPLLGEYRRFDDIYSLMGIPGVKNAVNNFIVKQWNEDCQNYLNNKPVSLLAKWLKSENASSEETKKYAAKTREILKLTPREYRKTLSTLRKYIDVVERKMSSQNWQSIDYETVPSKANLNYNKAFLKHDEERRRAYLDALSKGEAKINSSVTYPYEIANKYVSGRYGIKSVDQALEGMWKALPNYMKDTNESILVVADGSGSMYTSISKSTTATALCISNALAIYFSERLHGEFKDKFITFSNTPKFVDLSGYTTLKFVDLSGYTTLKDKLVRAYKENDCSNTNIEATFMMILNTAISNHMRQEDMPTTILIITDCHFDSLRGSHYEYTSRGYRMVNAVNYKALFPELIRRFEEAGYKMPKLVFWNLSNRDTAIPVTVNEEGVILLGGFSPATMKMALTGKTDPYEAMVDVLLNKRYDPVEEAVLRTVN